jgi:hypothetical protein
MSWIANIINNLLSNHENESLTIFGYTLLLNYMLPLFQSPFDFFIILDNSVFGLFILIAISATQKNTKKLISKGEYELRTNYKRR